MVREINAFMTRLGNDRNSEGFLWYAGHAMEISGEIFLFPLDINIENDELIRATSYSVNDLTRQFEGARNKVNVMVLDACRVPPSDSRSRTTGDTTRVIRTVPLTPPDLFVIYSTAPGTVALDGTGRRNSPFAEAFLNNIRLAEPITIMATYVTSGTMTLTGNRQRPHTSGSMSSNNAYYSLNPSGMRPNPNPNPNPPPNPDFEMNGTVLVRYRGNAANVTIPFGVTVIGDDAFRNNTSLTNIIIPASVTSIGSSAFYHCTSLTSITIPASVTSIGFTAFVGWRASQTINVHGKTNQSAADAAWGTDWRWNCRARINYSR